MRAVRIHTAKSIGSRAVFALAVAVVGTAPVPATADVVRDFIFEDDVITSGVHHGFDHHHGGPLEDILHRAHLPAASLADGSPRMIDAHRMHARDCMLDLRRGGLCVLRFDESDRIDVAADGLRRARRYRYELLERVLDTVE